MTRAAVAAGLVEAHDEVAGAVVGDLDGVDLDAGAGDRDGRWRRRRRRAAGHDPHGQVEALGLGDDVGEAGAVREQAHASRRGGPGRRRGPGSGRRGRG